MLRYLSSLLALLLMVGVACAQTAYNGTGSITRPDNATPYGTGAVTKLIASNTSGNATPGTIIVGGTATGTNYITDARIRTTGTAASGAAYKVYLFTMPPITTGLVDGSTYVGPYAADLPGYVGTLTCSGMQPTNDGTAQYYANCSGSSQIASAIRFPGAAGQTKLYDMVEVTAGYTPINKEVESVDLATTN